LVPKFKNSPTPELGPLNFQERKTSFAPGEQGKNVNDINGIVFVSEWPHLEIELKIYWIKNIFSNYNLTSSYNE
jgi:hypothetical protein